MCIHSYGHKHTKLHLCWIYQQNSHPWSQSLQAIIHDRIWEMGPYCINAIFLPFFKLPPFQGHRSPRLPTWFVGSLGLLLHRSKLSHQRRHNGDFWMRSTSPRPHHKWAGLRIPCEDGERIWGLYFSSCFKTKIQKMCDIMVPFLISYHICGSHR